MRYVVELENNHHYILIDTVTGRSYFTPAQDDANSLAGIMNNYINTLENQRTKIRNYEAVLGGNGLLVKKEHHNPSCKTCRYASITFLTGEDGIYCDKHNDTYDEDYHCKYYEQEE